MSLNLSRESERNYSRRALGLFLCFALTAAFAVSCAWSWIHPGRAAFAAAWWLVPGACIVAVNLHLAILRPWWFRLRRRSHSEYKHASGIPVVGTLALLPALAFGWGAAGTSLLGVALTMLDLAGPTWFLICTWRDTSLWDRPWRASSSGGGTHGL